MYLYLYLSHQWKKTKEVENINEMNKKQKSHPQGNPNPKVYKQRRHLDQRLSFDLIPHAMLCLALLQMMFLMFFPLGYTHYVNHISKAVLLLSPL